MSRLSPQTLTTHEQAALLRQVEGSPREALLFSLALGTGLRLAEVVGLDVGDVFLPGGHPKCRIRLRREIAKRGRVGDLFLPDRIQPKLERFWSHKGNRGEALNPGAPLFCAQTGRRLSKRRVQVLFRELQIRTGLDRHYPLHALRHTAITNVYRFRRICSSPSTAVSRRFSRAAAVARAKNAVIPFE